MQRFYRWALPTIVLSALLTPSLYAVLPGAPELRVSDLVAVIFVAVVLLSRRAGAIITWGLPQKLILVVFVAACGSLLIGVLLGLPGGLRDVPYIGRFLVYGALYTLVSSAVALDRRNVDRVFRWLAVGTLGLALVVIQQYWDLFGLNERYVKYISPTHYTTLLSHTAGPVGMTGGANELGFMCSLLALCMLHVAISRRQLRYGALFLLAGFLEILTGSRGGAMGLAVGVTMYGVILLVTLLSWGRGRPFAVAALIALVLGAAAYVFVVLSPDSGHLAQRFSALSDPARDPDFVARQIQWKINVDLFARSPIVGVGPLTQGTHAADNEWVLFLRAYGIAGTLLIASTLASMVLSGRPSPERILGLAVLSAAAVYMIPGSVVSSTSVMPLFIMILGICSGQLPRIALTRDLPGEAREFSPDRVMVEPMS